MAEFAPYLVKLCLHGHLSLGLMVGGGCAALAPYRLWDLLLVLQLFLQPNKFHNLFEDYFFYRPVVACTDPSVLVWLVDLAIGLSSSSPHQVALNAPYPGKQNLRDHLIHRVIFGVLGDLASPGSLEMAGVYTAASAAA